MQYTEENFSTEALRVHCIVLHCMTLHAWHMTVVLQKDDDVPDPDGRLQWTFELEQGPSFPGTVTPIVYSLPCFTMFLPMVYRVPCFTMFYHVNMHLWH